MPMGDLARVDEYDPFDAEKFANPAVKQMLGDILTLPQRAIQNSQFAVDTGVYDPAVPVEAAMTVMGGSAVPRVPVKAGEVAVGSGPIRAYHSSPHDFDRFDLSKIGTGEGAQVYGHGLYFAENPAVSGQGGQYWEQFLRHPNLSEGQQHAGGRLRAEGFDREKAIAATERDVKDWREGALGNDERAKRMLALREAELKALLENKAGPRTYEVNINADPAHMLDWDKPLREQQQVLDALSGSRRKAVRETLERQDYLAPTRETYGRDIGPVTGQDFYKALSYNLTGKPGAAQSSGALQAGGIPGIKYLDEGSRFIPQQIADARSNLSKDWQPGMRSALEKQLAELEKKPVSSNYVVFDPSIVNIMKKYGIAGAAPVGMGALAATGNYQPEERY